jgi:hypothetical protein
MNNHSFIPTAVDQMCTFNNQYGNIATYVLQVQKENPELTLLNCISHAHDLTCVISTNYRFYGGQAPVSNPIAFLTFIQRVMNIVCRLANNDLSGKVEQDSDDVAAGGGNGIDFSQGHTDKIGFSVATNKIEELINEDFFQLTMLHTFIGQGMEYINDIPPLHYHALNVLLDDGTWTVAQIAESFDEAIEVMSQMDASAKQARSLLRKGDARTMDFSARAKVAA